MRKISRKKEDIKTYYLGIDPGAKGGFALLHDTTLEFAYDFDKGKFLDIVTTLAKEQEATRCCLERVHAMPNQGSVSMFSFGESYGWLRGVLEACEVSYQTVEPRKWKAEFGLNSDKNKSIEVAKQLFPSIQLIPPGCRKPHDGIAESAILAEYARRKL